MAHADISELHALALASAPFEIPIGSYTIEVIGAVSTISSRGNPMLDVRVRVVDAVSEGQRAAIGEEARLWITAGENVLRQFFDNLLAFGITAEWMIEHPGMAALAVELPGKRACAVIKPGKERNDGSHWPDVSALKPVPLCAPA